MGGGRLLSKKKALWTQRIGPLVARALSSLLVDVGAVDPSLISRSRRRPLARLPLAPSPRFVPSAARRPPPRPSRAPSSRAVTSLRPLRRTPPAPLRSLGSPLLASFLPRRASCRTASFPPRPSLSHGFFVPSSPPSLAPSSFPPRLPLSRAARRRRRPLGRSVGRPPAPDHPPDPRRYVATLAREEILLSDLEVRALRHWVVVRHRKTRRRVLGRREAL